MNHKDINHFLPRVMCKKQITLLFLSVLGSLLSLYATLLTIKVRESNFTVQSLCMIDSVFDCNAVAASEYALLLGVPVAWWAFTYYLWICSVVTWTMFSHIDQKPILTMALLISILAAAVSIYKGWQMMFQLKIVCLVCVLMYFANAAITLLLMGLSGWKLKSTQDNYATVIQQTKEKSFKQNILSYFPGLFSVIVVFLIGYLIISISFASDGINRLETALPQNDSIFNNKVSDNALAHHYAQTKRTIELVSDAPMWGNERAAITVVEFSDFQCPFCQIAAIHLRDLLSEFKDQLKLYFIHYPLDKSLNPEITTKGHKYAGLAACAAMYAYDRGQFWQFHDDLFLRQGELNKKTIFSLAHDYGWNINQFELAVKSMNMISRIKKHIKCGQDMGIQGTPTIFINGRLVEQWQDAAVLHSIIKNEMQNPI